MHWNEKIDLIKKEYSSNDFSVPHIDRKEIFRKIESKFIKRSKLYYELNHSNQSFTNWWENLNSTTEEVTHDDLEITLRRFLQTNQNYWIGCEFSNQILIYNAKIPAIIHLISIGRSKTKLFHIIGLKYDFYLSLKIEKDETLLKYVNESA